MNAKLKNLSIKLRNKNILIFCICYPSIRARKDSKCSPKRLLPMQHEHRPMMTAFTIYPWKFAQDCQDGWNNHGLDRMMAHYHKEMVFRSAKAQALVGKGGTHWSSQVALLFGRSPKAPAGSQKFKSKRFFKAMR